MSTAASDAEPDENAILSRQITLRGSVLLMVGNAARLLRVLRLAAPRALSLVIVGVLIEAVATTLLPYSTRRIFDAVQVANGAATAAFAWLCVEAGLLTAQAAGTNLSRYYTRVFEWRAGPFLVERVLEKTARVAYAKLESTKFLDTLMRARQDSEHFGVNYALQMVLVGRSLLMFAGCLGLLLWIAPLWTVPMVIVAAALPFSLEIARARESYELERSALHRKRQAWYLEWLLTASEPAKEIRATGVGSWLVNLHAKIHAPFLDGQVAVARKQFRKSWLAVAVTTLALYGPYVHFLLATVRHERTLGELLMFVLTFRQSTIALNQLLTAFANGFEHHLYVHNILDVLGHPEEDAEDSAPDADQVLAEAPALKLDDLVFTYPGSTRPVIRGMSLEVRAGETIALVGRNGIGKTTLVKTILGLYPLDRGTVSIAGVDASTRSAQWRRDNIGVVFQDFIRYQFSARWNVGLGWCPESENDELITQALAMAEAEPIVSDLRDGLDTPLGAAFGGQDLSGGQWQRIALARLFMRRSRIWILDEPTSAMDPETEERAVRLFRRWTQGRTALVITHRFSTARIADRIAVVDEGRVVELGTHEELLAAGGGYARIFKMQALAYT